MNIIFCSCHILLIEPTKSCTLDVRSRVLALAGVPFLWFKGNTKTQSTFSFISELRPHTATVTLYSWIIVIIQAVGDCVISVEGDASSSGVLSESSTRPWWMRSPRPVLVPDSAGQHCAVTRLGCLSHLIFLDRVPVTSPVKRCSSLSLLVCFRLKNASPNVSQPLCELKTFYRG